MTGNEKRDEMTQNWQRMSKAAVHGVLLILTGLYLVSGLGITQYRIVEALTLGLLTRSVAFTIHDALLVPFVALLCLHVAIGPITWIISRMERHSS